MKSCCSLLLLSLVTGIPSTSAQDMAATGVTGGLVVHVGCGDGEETVRLRLDDRFLVHGLDTDPGKIRFARRTLRKRGEYGTVAVARYDGSRLPYMDNVVNLIVVSSRETNVAAAEIQRVLAPRGVALVDPRHEARIVSLKPQRKGSWLIYRKPADAARDTWSHYLHGPDNNAVSQDSIVAPPKRLQWQCGPRWSRSHETDMSMSGAVSASGRIIYFIDDGPIGVHETPEQSRRLPDTFSLVGRDAYSGVRLWKRPVENWGSRAWDNDRWWKKNDQMWSSPQTLPRRIVAVGDRVFVTLGYRTHISELDARSGRTVREFKAISEVDEFLVAAGNLIVRARSSTPPAEKPSDVLAVVDTQSGKTRWRKRVGRLIDVTLASASGRIGYVTGKAVVVRDLQTGEELWRETLPGMRLPLPSLVFYRDIVIVATGGRRAKAYAFSAKSGDRLWEREAGSGSFRGSADVFVANGLLWMGTLSTKGIDPSTGTVLKKIAIPSLFTKGHHARCYRARATDNFLLWSKRGVEFLDLVGQNHSRNDWVRGTCRYGVMPANGLLYAPPMACFCFPGVKLNGFTALAPEGTPGTPIRNPAHRFERGPAFARQTADEQPASSPRDWPAYRHDNTRSGATSVSLSVQLARHWNTRVGGALTPPVMAQNRLFVADKETHSVHCLDATTGKPLWYAIAGGVVDSPPTVYGNRVLFGCTDGWVTCLRVEDGALAWRFRAAPRDQRIVSYGQVQSSWPVHGSVLVKRGIAYVVAGRSSFLDGGLFLYGLDVATGAVRYQHRLDGPWAPAEKESPHGAHWMDGGLNDILVSSADKLYLMQNVFDLSLRPLDAPVIAPHGARAMDRHVAATGGFLDTTGFDRIFWMHAELWPGFYYGYNAPKTGQILVFDHDTTYALHTFAQRFSRSPYFAPGRTGYDLVADDNTNEPYLDPKAARHEREPGYSRKQPPKWKVKIPIRVLAMVLAADTLFLAGPPDKIDTDDPLATFEGRGHAILRAVSTRDGSTRAEYVLDAQPVFDGLIAASGRLFISTRDGRVVCFGETRKP